MTFDQRLLQAALLGLETRKARVEGQITSVKTMMGNSGRGRPRKTAIESKEPIAEMMAKKPKKDSAKQKRKLSPEAHERMAAAQRKRWAAARGEEA